MRVQAIRAFHDLEMKCWRNRGDVFDASEERTAYLVALDLVKVVEQPKTQAKRTTRKRTTKE